MSVYQKSGLHSRWTDLASDLNVSTVTGTNDQTSVQHKLHVGSSRSLSSCSRDMLADIRCWRDNLTLGHIVVLDENNLQRVANVRIRVDDSTDLVN